MYCDQQLKPTTKTFYFGKYVIAADAFLPIRRSEAAPSQWHDTAELIRRFPDEITRQVVNPGRRLPEYRYQYFGNESFYSGGVMPEMQSGPDWLLKINHGRALGRYCVIHGPGGIGFAQFNYDNDTLRHLTHMRGGKWSPRYWRHAFRAWRNRSLPPAKCVSGRVAALNLPGSNNYFHWIVEVLPRLHTLQQSGIEPDWYLVDCYTAFHTETLRAMNVPLDRVIQPRSGLYVEADHLLVPSRGFPGACREVGSLLIERLGSPRKPSSARRIFINRRGSRLPHNVQQFRAVLDRFGFEQHYMEDCDLPTQIALFRNAEAIVGMHGAGLANLIFSRSGTHVVELMPEGKLQACYPMLSRLGGLHHYLLSAKRVGFHQDMLVPIAQMESVLSEIDSQLRHHNAA